MLCFAPLILAGYMFTLTPNPSHTSNVDGAVVEVQTCEVGPGLHAKATTSELFGGGMHWGVELTEPASALRVTFQPKLDISATTTPRRELPQGIQFGVGAQFLFTYKEYPTVAVEYWHLSNAGTTSPNIGKETIAITATVWRF